MDHKDEETKYNITFKSNSISATIMIRMLINTLVTIIVYTKFNK